MTIFLVRHGETLLNASRVLQPADTPLSPRGRAQAQALAARLSRENLGAIVSSDLPRARETAEPIAAACGLAIVLEPLLQERNFGDLRGLPYDGLGFDPLTMPAAPPNGESLDAFRARVAQAFAKITARQIALGGSVAVVTHGLVLHVLLQDHVSIATGQALPTRIANTSVTMLSATSPHTAELLNCTAHLLSDDKPPGVDGIIGDDPLGLSGG